MTSSRFASVPGASAALTALLVVSSARAQSTDPAGAEALFRAARAEADRGEYAAACPKFRESNRLDPAVGTVFNIADCEEHVGRLATAWSRFHEVQSRLPPSDPRHGVAADRIHALEPRLPYLTVRLAPSAPATAEVIRNGVPLSAASLGAPLPVDPGEQVVEVRVGGHEPRVFRATLAEAQRSELTVFEGPAAGSSPVTHAEAGASKPVTGYVILGVGIAAMAAGGVMGAMAISKKDTVDQNCDASKVCNQTGVDAANSGRTLSTVGTVALAAGAVGAGVGLYFILSGGPGHENRTELRGTAVPGGGVLGLRGTF